MLIGVAVGGSGLVYRGAADIVSPGGGPAVYVAGATIRQGELVAVESLTVYDSGSAPLGSFVISTSAVQPAATYCYTVYDPLGRAVLTSTCPSMSAGPGSVAIGETLAPGAGVVVTLVIQGASFQPGGVCQVTVTASDGAQQTLAVEVVPA